MTNEEAIRLLREESKDASGRIAEACAIGAEAIKHRTPKKPNKARCPSCGSPFQMYGDKFCDNCGQSIDWSDECERRD